MDKTGSLQIGHSFIKEKDFKIKCKVTNDQHVEVPFSPATSFMQFTGSTKVKGHMSSIFKNTRLKPTESSLFAQSRFTFCIQKQI